MVYKAAALIAIVFLFSVSSITPIQAHAQLVVFDPTNAAINGATAGSAATDATTNTLQTITKRILDPIAWAVAKQAIQVVTKSTVNWINSGYHGAPSFVTDLNGTLLSVANAAADTFIKQLATNVQINSPYRTQIASAVQSAYNLQQNASIFLSNPYTLQKYSTNDKAFLAGNFSQGGFSAWAASWSNAANNPYGAYMLAMNALGVQTTSAQGTRQTELNWAKGFLSWRGDCAQYAVGNTTLSNSDACLTYKINTPGSVIESQLENTLGSPIRQLELADSFNQIIGAAVTQLTSSVLGATGLTGLTQTSSVASTNAPINAITDPSAYSASIAGSSEGIQQNLQQQQAQIASYNSSWSTIQSAALQAQSALQSSTCYPNAQSVIQTKVQPVLDQAQAALAKGGNALAALSKVQTEVTSASTNATASSQAANDYQQLIASPAIPSAMDASDATIQSAPGGTGDAATLYSQMTQLTSDAQTCASGATQPQTQI